jgi:hypothetical protein
MSWYLTLRGDKDYSRFVETEKVISFVLSTFPNLRQTRPRVIESLPNTPWLEIHLAHCDARGNYGFNDTTNPTHLNCIEFICSAHEEPAYYYDLAQTIAKFLGWEVFDDNTWETPPDTFRKV